MLGLALVLTGCAHQSTACAGVGGGSMACRAAEGDQLAQLRLGMAYELGIGVPRDEVAAARLYHQAARLYHQAAAFVSGTTYVYSPPVGRSAGRVIPIRTGVDRAGLPQAKSRLAELYLTGRGVPLNRAKALRLLEEAAQGGDRLAAARLAALQLEK